jgi:hypothetical protein
MLSLASACATPSEPDWTQPGERRRSGWWPDLSGERALDRAFERCPSPGKYRVGAAVGTRQFARPVDYQSIPRLHELWYGLEEIWDRAWRKAGKRLPGPSRGYTVMSDVEVAILNRYFDTSPYWWSGVRNDQFDDGRLDFGRQDRYVSAELCFYTAQDKVAGFLLLSDRDMPVYRAELQVYLRVVIWSPKRVQVAEADGWSASLVPMSYVDDAPPPPNYVELP